MPKTLATSGGNVRGPSSATDKSIAIFNGTTGKLIDDSGIWIDNNALWFVQGAMNTPPAMVRSFGFEEDGILYIKDENGAYVRVQPDPFTETTGLALTGYDDALGTWNTGDIDFLLPSQTGQNGKYLSTNGTVSSWQSVPPGYTNEEAQDAVGTILTDTATIDFTYNDGTPSITADVKASSITEAMQVLADNTTQNVSTAKHGYVPKGTNTLSDFLRDDGNWAGVIPSGTTFPATPNTGDFFLHAPTGRTVLYQYDGSTWQPIRTYGTTTIYVDGASGTDSITSGTGTGASAYDTIQYAIDSLPGTLGGNVTVNIASGTYAEAVTIKGKYFTGTFTLTVQGTLTVLDSLTAAASTQGTGATQGTVVRNAGTWTANARDRKIVSFTSGANSGTYRLVESNTTTTATIVGTWPSAVGVGDTFSVYDWGTIITGNVLITAGQTGVILNDLKLGGGTIGVSVTQFSGATANRIWGTGSSARQYDANQGGILTPNQCLAECTTAGPNGFNISGLSLMVLQNCLTYRASGTGTGILVGNGGVMNQMSMGSIVDGFTTGVLVISGGVFNFNNQVASGYCRVKNCTTGISATTGGQALGTANNQYSGNTADETATAASYGYID